ncbi:MAG TPA: hypothetical protein VG502_17050 [Flexivirga sp.]|uniref:hypothetical protein n=1 Tax=Flexivirga sp. TaxID=1962927 RepID=UPI002B770725|nr:hypothetical protein [Flexivirga sp.]HWC24006.1 hypothetical protein [Flexivirga sp.]
MVGSSNEDDALVVRVWYAPTFRARVTTTDPSGAGQSVVLADPEVVLTYVQEWMARTGPPSSEDDTWPRLPSTTG